MVTGAFGGRIELQRGSDAFARFTQTYTLKLEPTDGTGDGRGDNIGATGEPCYNAGSPENAGFPLENKAFHLFPQGFSWIFMFFFFFFRWRCRFGRWITAR